jgi:hypothetical protein
VLSLAAPRNWLLSAGLVQGGKDKPRYRRTRIKQAGKSSREVNEGCMLKQELKRINTLLDMAGLKCRRGRGQEMTQPAQVGNQVKR